MSSRKASEITNALLMPQAPLSPVVCYTPDLASSKRFRGYWIN
ncbi:hypothetical protein [Mycobacterium colombiense]|nr:hypothetical protein [Mycobacterium colombiense]